MQEELVRDPSLLRRNHAKRAPAASIDTVLSLFFDVVMLRPWQQQSRKAARALLSAPKEILTRPWREKFMKCVLSIIGELGCCGDNSDLLSDYALVLSLATRLMTEPTYYEVPIPRMRPFLTSMLTPSLGHGLPGLSRFRDLSRLQHPTRIRFRCAGVDGSVPAPGGTGHEVRSLQVYARTAGY